MQRGDVSSESDVRALVETAIATFGRVHVLVNECGGQESGSAIARVALGDAFAAYLIEHPFESVDAHQHGRCRARR